MTYSILEEARRAGYQKGREDEKAHQAQLSQCRYDDAREEGRCEGWQAGVRAGTIGLRSRWFFIGATFVSFFYWIGS